jgi:hypothetical protein
MALSDIAANKAKELATNLLQDVQGQIATSRSQISYSNAIEKQKASIESARLTQEELQKIISLNSGSPWPQIKPDSAVKGKMGTAMVYSVALSSTDITAIFNAQKASFGL